MDLKAKLNHENVSVRLFYDPNSDYAYLSRLNNRSPPVANAYIEVETLVDGVFQLSKYSLELMLIDDPQDHIEKIVHVLPAPEDRFGDMAGFVPPDESNHPLYTQELTKIEVVHYLKRTVNATHPVTSQGELPEEIEKELNDSNRLLGQILDKLTMLDPVHNSIIPPEKDLFLNYN